MYFGQVDPSQRFRIIGQKGGRRPVCPPGSQTESSGKLGTGQDYVWCYRPATFAPPPTTTITYHAPTTTVSPAIQAAISPQISPTLAQQQASPGAAVTGTPTQSMPGGQQATGGGTGMSAQEVMRILAEQRAADDARRAQEYAQMERVMAERQAMLEQQRQAEREAAEAREEARRREEAEAAERAEASAAAMPLTAGAAPPFVPPSPLQPPEPEPSALQIDADFPDVETGTAVLPAESQAVPWLLLAAAGIGAAYMLRGKKGAKRR